MEKKRDVEGAAERGVGRLEEELVVARREEEGWERKVQEAVGRLVLVEGELGRKEGRRKMLEGRRLELQEELKEVEGSISRISEGGGREADLEDQWKDQVGKCINSIICLLRQHSRSECNPVMLPHRCPTWPVL